jgi:alpha-1,2-glucosyltransferase
MEIKKQRQNFVSLGILFLLICCICLYFTSGNGLVADESAHAIQIQHFLDNEWVFLNTLTVPPTYHLIVTMISIPFDIHTLHQIRVVNCLLLVLLLIPVSYLITNRNLNKTIQILFFPIMFLYFFLIYTDIFSLIFVLFTFYFVKEKYYILSGISAGIAIFTRQNNVFFIGFILIYGFLMFYNTDKKWYINILKYTKKIIPVIISIILFSIYILYKGSVVQGDANQHPIALHLGNLYMFLFTFFFIFLFYIISKIPDIYNTIKNNGLANIGGLALILGVMNFENSHLYNQISGVWFNELLKMFDADYRIKILFLIPILLAYYTICSTKFDNPRYYLLYPFSIIYLMFSWLIEVRYYFIPMIFFLIFYKNKNDNIEIMTTVYYIIISILWFLTLIINEY